MACPILCLAELLRQGIMGKRVFLSILGHERLLMPECLLFLRRVNSIVFFTCDPFAPQLLSINQGANRLDQKVKASTTLVKVLPTAGPPPAT
jgi:hypothetical protein